MDIPTEVRHDIIVTPLETARHAAEHFQKDKVSLVFNLVNITFRRV
jgi:hypothetical protein